MDSVVAFDNRNDGAIQVLALKRHLVRNNELTLDVKNAVLGTLVVLLVVDRSLRERA